MQGIVKDDKGAYVKSAIVRLLKISDTASEAGEDAVTYAETDEDGKFVISDLGPDERYIIEIHVESPEIEAVRIEPEPEPIDSLNYGSTTGETIKMNLSVDSLYNIGFDPKDKPYLTKNNTW